MAAAAGARQGARARAAGAPAGSRLAGRAGRVRPAPQRQLRSRRAAALRRWRRHGLRHRARAQGVRVLAGLHGLRRLARRGLRREDLQGHGSGDALRLPRDRHQRLGRGAHPGRRRGARRLRGDLPPQRHGLGRRAADLARDGPVRRRRGLLARDHRLRAHDARHLAHVHHRPRGRAHRDRRGGLVRGPRRRRHARAALRRRAHRGRRRGRAVRRGPLPADVPAAEQPRARAARAHATTRASGRPPSWTRSSPTRPRSPTT